jgi:hypothetical protein
MRSSPHVDAANPHPSCLLNPCCLCACACQRKEKEIKARGGELKSEVKEDENVDEEEKYASDIKQAEADFYARIVAETKVRTLMCYPPAFLCVMRALHRVIFSALLLPRALIALIRPFTHISLVLHHTGVGACCCRCCRAARHYR